MNCELWASEARRLLEQLSQVDLGYPCGENVVRTASVGQAGSLHIENPAATRQIDEFFTVCDGISWPDVHNGYFIRRRADLAAAKDEFGPALLKGKHAGEVIVLGSSGGGDLFVLRQSQGDVLLLPGGLIVQNIYDNSDGRGRVIARDFKEFISRLLQDLAAFVHGDRDHEFLVQ